LIPLRDNIPSKTFPFINYALIAANGYVFFLELQQGHGSRLQALVDRWAVIPSQLWLHPADRWFTLITAMFLHGGWLHVLSNMLFLYIFGDNVEDTMGHAKYFLFYFLTGMFANATQAYLSASSPLPLLGASGAIAGVLGSYFFFYPYARVVTLIPFFIFFTIREIPAFFFLGFWFLLQTLNGVGSLSSQLVTKQSMGGVAWWAHASGFIAGLLMSPVFGKRTSKFR
jgi:membrane associated rhomboid family serine protease